MVFATSSLHSLTHLCPQMFSPLSTRALVLPISTLNLSQLVLTTLFHKKVFVPFIRNINSLSLFIFLRFSLFHYNSTPLIDPLMFINWRMFINCVWETFFFRRVKVCPTTFHYTFHRFYRTSIARVYFRSTFELSILIFHIT